MLELVAEGAKVKATGFSRCNFNVAEVMQQIYAVDSSALMFGTDLPSTRAPQPFSDEDVALVKDNFPEEAAQRIFYRNAKSFYFPR